MYTRSLPSIFNSFEEISQYKIGEPIKFQCTYEIEERVYLWDEQNQLNELIERYGRENVSFDRHGKPYHHKAVIFDHATRQLVNSDDLVTYDIYKCTYTKTKTFIPSCYIYDGKYWTLGEGNYVEVDLPLVR